MNDKINIEVALGDWRSRFEHVLPRQDGIVLISFDPYMFNRNPRKQHMGNMYPEDLDRVINSIGMYPENVLLQLSTYDTNDNNGQDAVSACIQSKLVSGGLEEVAIVRPNGKMMSLLYHRGIAFSEELTSLPNRFKAWFDTV